MSGYQGPRGTATTLPPELNPRSQRPVRRRRNPLIRLLRWLAVLASFAIVIGSGTGYGLFRYFDANITTKNVFSGLGGNRPAPTATGAANYLLVGSDSRTQSAGDARFQAPKGSAGYATTALSDTTILVHLSAGHQKALLVSIPRDSLVMIPACESDATGKTIPEHTGQFNSAFSEGGPTCTIKTVEQDTGVHVDHYAEIDFAGFQRMVNALGGVTMCLAKPISDPAVPARNGVPGRGTGLKLSAGTHTLDGAQALDLVRARYGIGDGSDLGRIQRQQQFLGALVRQATSASNLFRPDRLLSFLSALTDSITTDPGLTSDKLKDLALQLRGFDPAHVTFVTVPLDPDPGPAFDKGGKYAGRVKWDDARAQALFASMETDKAVGGAEPAPSAVPSDLTVPPNRIKVEVLNGSGTNGAAARAASDLRGEGFEIGSTGDADAFNYTATVVRYGPDRADSAKTVAAAIPGATVQEDGSLGRSQLKVVIGSSYHGTQSVSISPAAAPSSSAAPVAPEGTTAAANNACR